MKHNSLSIAGFVVSLSGLVLSIILGPPPAYMTAGEAQDAALGFGIFFVGTAVTGLVLSVKGRSKARIEANKTGLATAGMVLGIIGICLAVILVLAYISQAAI